MEREKAGGTGNRYDSLQRRDCDRPGRRPESRKLVLVNKSVTRQGRGGRSGVTGLVTTGNNRYSRVTERQGRVVLYQL